MNDSFKKGRKLIDQSRQLLISHQVDIIILNRKIILVIDYAMDHV